MIFDSFRQKYVRLTPEEWIRQHFLEYLVRVCRYPASLIAVEMAFQYQEMRRRADIVVHDRIGRPFLMAECKAQDVQIVQSTFDQVSRYNRVVGARYLTVTNGVSHYCWQVDTDTGSYRFLDGIPKFGQME
ncbi:MAG: type I restriction enzyme HsdR N-terminal domain-containing protein [Rhodothermales bacterium]